MRKLLQDNEMIQYDQFNKASLLLYVQNFKFRENVSGNLLNAFLSNTPGVIDVSALSSLLVVSLSYLDEVTDVSALSAVYDLSLEYMDGVRDVSALSTVHKLTLNGMYEVRDVSALSTVALTVNLMNVVCM